MVFGLFGKKGTKDKALEKGKKLLTQGRAGEALGFFEEVLEEDPTHAEAKAAERACRESLVAWNIEEASHLTGHDAAKALEHFELALTLAGGEDDLRANAQAALDGAGLEAEKAAAVSKPKDEKPARMFPPTCGCASASCHGDGDEQCGDQDPEDLFWLYLETTDVEEARIMENLGSEFKHGYVALQLGDADKALEHLAKARQTDDASSAALPYAEGLALWQAGKLEEAEAKLAETSGLLPDFTPAILRRAMLMREMSRPAEAVELLLPVVDGAADNTGLTILAAALAEAGRVDEAVERMRPLDESGEIKTDSNLATLYGKLLEGAGDEAGALRAYQIATTVSPENLDALEPMGMLLIRRGGRDAENAVKVFKQCYRVNPGMGWRYLLRISEAYAARGWLDQARQMLADAKNELPDDKNAHSAWEAVNTALSRLG